MSFDVNQLDERGFLADPDTWNAEKARAIGEHLGLSKLTKRHFAVMRRLREHYQQHDAIPPPSLVCHELDLADDCIDVLFAGPLNAWRTAGLPDPGEEARIYMDNQTITDSGAS